jgi:hypothetical protein
MDPPWGHQDPCMHKKDLTWMQEFQFYWWEIGIHEFMFSSIKCSTLCKRSKSEQINKC